MSKGHTPRATFENYSAKKALIARRGQLTFAVDVLQTEEVGRLTNVSRLSKEIHPLVDGTIALHGQLFSVIDIANSFPSYSYPESNLKFFITLRTTPNLCLSCDEILNIIILPNSKRTQNSAEASSLQVHPLVSHYEIVNHNLIPMIDPQQILSSLEVKEDTLSKLQKCCSQNKPISKEEGS